MCKSQLILWSTVYTKTQVDDVNRNVAWVVVFAHRARTTMMYELALCECNACVWCYIEVWITLWWQRSENANGYVHVGMNERVLIWSLHYERLCLYHLVVHLHQPTPFLTLLHFSLESHHVIVYSLLTLYLLAIYINISKLAGKEGRLQQLCYAFIHACSVYEDSPISVQTIRAQYISHLNWLS